MNKNIESIKEFHNFINKTIGKKLTINEVLEKYKRINDKSETIEVNTSYGKEKFPIIHFGENHKKFRIFGFILSGYFIITKIDTNHKTHSK
ncbi:MAG6450 family protein [Metamycoplasma buccale]|uniref:MAG6450 family protein n=1 Tax=Metamycoplasma buccale TaxID=55602 RepID=UPI00398EBCC6